MHTATTRFLQNLHIRTKFLLVPLLATINLALLGGLSLHFFATQKTLLLHVVRQDLVEIDTLTKLFSQLSANHVQIFDLLAAAGTDMDEAQLYDLGKTKMHRIDRVVAELNDTVERLALTDYERRPYQVLVQQLTGYRVAAVTAIEMASVDLALAAQYMIKANQSYSEVNTQFVSLLNEARNDGQSALLNVLDTFDRKAVEFSIILGLSVLSTAVITMVLATFLSNEIRAMTGIMAALATGHRHVEIPHDGRRDEIGTMAHAMHVFKQSLFRLTESEANATALNQQLAEEIRQRQQAQEELRQSNEALEERVAERTVDLQQMNAQLQTEIAERKLLEGQLAQAQKLEAIGQLAAGIAHEINTPTQL
jgi:phosphoglycerate-specific signal transduction histidine kinase